jgi:hypothetical protein
VRSLSADLEAAQQSASARPYVQCLVNDYWGERSRLRFTRLYTGAEPEGFVAAVFAPDGSLIRARLEDNGSTATLYVSRVASPGSGSTWSSWTSLEAGVSDVAGCALALDGTTLLLFYVASNDTSIRLRTSTDNGQTWSSASTILTAGGAVGYMAAAVSTFSGDRVLVWSEGATVYRSRFSSGAWGARTAWTNSVASITGLAMTHQFDFQVMVAGTQASTLHPRVFACRFGDGAFGTLNAWSALRDVAFGSAEGDVTFSSPAVCVSDNLYRAWFVEHFGGDEAYDRLHATEMETQFDFSSGDFWREPSAIDYSPTTRGVAVAVANASETWLVAASGVWYSDAPALPGIDVTADVVEASVVADANGSAAVVSLDNADGRYTSYGAGDFAVLQRGARMQLSPGYHTASGAEVNEDSPFAYWIDSIELVTGAQPRLVLRARDAASLIASWRSRRQHVWANGDETVVQLIWRVLRRAGLSIDTTDASGLITTLEPAFTIHPGESGDTAMRRLLDMTSSIGRWRTAGFAVVTPDASDTATYSFGDGHAILSGRYVDRGLAANRVRVVGLDKYNEALDLNDMAATGERVAQLVDADLTTSAMAEDRAEAFLRLAEVDSRADVVQVFGVHCGLEMYDVVAITDAQAGLDAAKRRVLGFAWHYATGSKPRYDMTLTLGLP